MDSDLPAGLPRRPTADAHRFVIPADQLPAGFARRPDALPSLPVAPRPAATVVLLREHPAEGAPAGGRPEALLLRRHGGSGFAAGAWVFPGGRVDPEDRDPALPALCGGPPPEAWARRLGLADPLEAFGYVAAALREAFEETGILLARPAGAAPGPGRPAPEAMVLHRAALLAEETSLREIAVASGLRYAMEDFVYLAHWITPEPEARRYDTRFFLAPLPGGQECVPHEPELVEARWMTPADAVERFAAGEMAMLPPTVHTLRRLAAFRSLPELLDALRDAPVPAILPTMRWGAEGVVIEIADSG